MPMTQRRSVPTVCALAAALLAANAPSAWSIGDAPAKVPPVAVGAGTEAQKAPEPGIQAMLLYNDGIDELRRADNSAAAAGAPTDSAKRSHEQDEARALYSTALGKFQQAVRLDPRMYQAWNYLGYAHRKLGDYDDALEAYERALALHPGYPEALEYRAEAYLGVKRIADAKQSYLDLFATNRSVAGKLLEAMRSWIVTQRAAAAPAELTVVNDLDSWVQERAQIAAQTASLTREGTAAGWR